MFPVQEQISDPSVQQVYRTERGYAVKLKLVDGAKLTDSFPVLLAAVGAPVGAKGELSGNTLDRDTYKQLAMALVDNHTLHTLRLAAMNNMEEEHFVSFLGPALQVNSGLVNLDLSTNKLGARFVSCALSFRFPLLYSIYALRCALKHKFTNRVFLFIQA